MKEQRGKFKLVWEVFSCLLILFIMFVSPCTGAEDPEKFPSRPITIIVPWAAGGSTDLTSRKLADITSKIIGQPILVENRVGGGGVIGTAAVARVQADGYTIGNATASSTVYAPHLREVPYKTKEEFSWILGYADQVHPFAVLPDSRWKTFKDFLEEGRKNPGKLTYAGSGPLGGQHIFMEQLTFEEKVKFTHVPMGGGSEVVTKVLGGHIDAGFTTELSPHVAAGKLRALAIASETKVEAFPNVPTFRELGYKVPNISWVGLYAPKGLHPVVFKKLVDAFTKGSEDPSFKEFLRSLNIPFLYRGPEAFQEKVYSDFDNNARVIKALGLVAK